MSRDALRLGMDVPDPGAIGRVDSINVSNGGIPKRPRPCAWIGPGGVEGDRQRNRRHHGGPDRAVCLYGSELIEALRVEGHPIQPGAIGENLTLAGLRWTTIQPGVRLTIGDVELEVTAPAHPCRTITGAFRDGVSTRVSENAHPGWSRWYCRVLREGRVCAGARARISSSEPGNAERRSAT